MKKLMVLTIVLVLLAVNFSLVLAAPWNNPNGWWLEGVTCGDDTFDVWVFNDYTVASFDEYGGVGITKALYIYDGDLDDYVLVWKVPGKGVFKNTTWCTWELDGMLFGGEILVP